MAEWFWAANARCAAALAALPAAVADGEHDGEGGPAPGHAAAAAELRLLADDHGHARAAVAYGRCLEIGVGTSADNDKALEYFSRAVTQHGRTAEEVDGEARAAGSSAARALMLRRHLAAAHKGVAATARAAGVQSFSFQAEVIHREAIATATANQTSEEAAAAE